MDDARFQADLRRYWDEIVAGRPAALDDLDPDLTALIRRLHAPGDVPRPDPSYATRLREDLMHTAAHPWHPLTPSSPLTSNGRTLPYGFQALTPSLARPSRWSRALAQFATAALVAVTLVVAVVLVRSPGGSPPDDNPARLPALLVPATPSSPEATATGSRETVLATTLPGDLVPTAGNLDFVLWHAMLNPGEGAAFETDAVDCCPGPQITHVIAGELTLRVDGPVQLVRGSDLASGASGAEDVAAGSEMLLRPGDTAIYDFARPAEYANHGADPLHMVGGGLLAGSMAWTPAGMTLLDGNEEYSAPALPPGPVHITLIRATLPPRGTLPAPPPDSLILEVGAEGDASIGQGADGSLRNIGPQEETFYALAISPAGGSTGTPTP